DRRDRQDRRGSDRPADNAARHGRDNPLRTRHRPRHDAAHAPGPPGRAGGGREAGNGTVRGVMPEGPMRRPQRLLVLAISLPASPAWGQPVPSREPSSTHIFPAGGRRGTTVTVRVGGECMPPGMKLTLWGDGLTAPALLGDRVAPRYE